MNIAGHSTDEKVFVIAEIGNNHEGSLSLAQDLIGLAAKAGADAVKFQTIVPEKLVDKTQVDRIKQLNRLCLKPEDFQKLAKTAQEENVIFMSTPFDLDAVDLLNPLVPAFKIASSDNNFYPLIRKAAQTGKPLIISSGMLDVPGIEKMLGEIRKIHAVDPIGDKVCVMQCVSMYPVDPENAGLNSIRDIARLGVTPGYSDHTLGIDACVAAVAVGARVIEKHFTISNTYSEFRDHQLSADPSALKLMIEKIRNVEKLLGAPGKTITDAERTSIPQLRRAAVAGRDLRSGDCLKQEDILWVRGGGGIGVESEDRLIGKTITMDISHGEPITEKILNG